MNRQNRQLPRQKRPDRRAPTFASHVPTTQEVVPGALVSIVLKADQPTGREVQGSVKDLLTRGDHPRGIKVRLSDGRIGRVQNMATGGQTQGTLADTGAQSDTSRTVHAPRYQDYRQDGYAEGPPPRTLADFLPADTPRDVSRAQERSGSEKDTGKVVKCPFCDAFEGDELAVSHHIEEHLT